MSVFDALSLTAEFGSFVILLLSLVVAIVVLALKRK